MGNEIDAVGAFSALEVEKSLLTIKPQDFIERARCRRITVYVESLPQNVKREVGYYHCYSFFFQQFYRPPCPVYIIRLALPLQLL